MSCDREDEAGRALRALLEADVEPDGRVEGGLLVEEDVGELGLEGVGVLIGGEVAALAAPAGDRAGDAADHLADRRLALVGAHPAAEVLLRDDVGGVLRPRRRELDAALLEGGVLGIADDSVAELPLDLVERVDSGRRVAALDLDSVGVCAGGCHRQKSPRLLPAAGFSGVRTVLSGSDGIGPREHPNFRGDLGQRAGELEVGATVDRGEPLEAELADPLGR